ncbi:MAG: DUF748 domain-containing protein [Bacteroidaceae bacterium]|nr:DUF748 domain-containing protein [Bacteroidaceae bacterium]
MKKGLRITIIVISVIVALLLVASLLVSPIAKWYVEKNCKDLIGRKITIENLDIRLLLGRVAADNLVLYEANETDTFVSIEHFDADVRVWGILRKSIIVDSINVVSPNATILRQGNGLNFDDMLVFFAQKSAGETNADTIAQPDTIKETSNDNSWQIILRDIALNRGKIRYADDIIDIDWTMHHIELNIPEIDLSGSGTKAQLYFDFARGGSLALNAMFDQPTMDYELNCKISDYPVGVLMPFMKGVVNVGNVAGSLGIDLHAQGNIDNIMASILDGSIQLDSTYVDDINGQRLISLNQFKTDIEHIDIAHDYNIKLRNFLIDGVSAGYEVYRDGSNNFTSLFATAPQEEAEAQPSQETPENVATNDTVEAPKLNITVENIVMQNSNFAYTDNTLPEPFTLRLSKMRFKTPMFSTQGVNDVELFAVLQETGALRIKWNGNIEAQNHDLSLSLNNFNLKDISPYSLSFFGYPITDGKLSFRGQNIISDSQLKGTNKLSLYNPTVEKKRSDVDAQFGMVPLKLAIVVLTDREGKADIDLPISGDIKSPHFSYGNIIVQALVNVLVKIAAAPIDLMAEALGLNSNEIKEIEFGAWQHQFTPEQYDKIEKLSKIIAEEPELQIRLQHEVNFEKGIQAIVENDLKREYYLAQNPERAQSLNMVDIDTYQKTSLKDPGIILFADSLLTVKGLPTDGNINDKMHRLYGSAAVDKLMRNIEMRNRGMMMQWSNALNMPEGSLQIVTPTQDEIKLHNGKTRYKVEITAAGDEVETTEAVVTDESIGDDVSETTNP